MALRYIASRKFLVDTFLPRDNGSFGSVSAPAWSIKPLRGLSLTVPVLVMAQKQKLAHLALARFRMVETHNDRTPT